MGARCYSFLAGFFFQEERIPLPSKLLSGQAGRKVRQKESWLIGDLPWSSVCRSPLETSTCSKTPQNGQRLAGNADHPGAIDAVAGLAAVAPGEPWEETWDRHR